VSRNYELRPYIQPKLNNVITLNTFSITAPLQPFNHSTIPAINCRIAGAHQAITLPLLKNFRGNFVATGKSGSKIKVYFTLIPENSPRIQRLKLNIV
jgi:hypothetical protein